jgi:hypothetical protein
MQRIRSTRDERGFVLLAGAAVFAVAASASAQQFQDQTSTRFPSPGPAEYTNYVAVSDVDLDDDLDLVFANGGGFSSPGAAAPLRVYINDGNGFFADESSTRVAGISGYYRGVDLGDVDGDGDDDMLIVSDFNRRPRLLINDGTGVFVDQSAFRLPLLTLSATRGPFADVDNDGDLDIYINHGGATNRFGCGQNRILINNGLGVFTDDTNARHPLGNVCQPMDVIFGDIDNDFDLDIRTGNRGTNNSRLYENDGTGVFTDISGGVPGDSQCYSYDFGDFDGDGLLDMLGANAGPSNQELLLKGDGAGGFTNVSGNISPNTSGDDNDSKFFDLDDDGDLDLVVAALFQSREKVFINDGAGNFTQDTTIITSNNDATLDVMVADFNDDGRPDIVTGQGEAGSFLNRIYINTSGAPDTVPPDVARTEQHPDTDDTVGPYVVRAAIFDGITSDRGFFDRGVTLEFTVNGGPPQQVPMTWSGNSLWRGEIPGQAPGSTVAYFVTALDYASNLGTGETLVFQVGGVIPGDLDGDGDVDINDLLQLLAAWGPCPGCPEDLDGDGDVDINDLLQLLANWT